MVQHGRYMGRGGMVEGWGVMGGTGNVQRNSKISDLDLTMIYFSRIKIMCTDAFMYTHSGCSV